MLAHCFCALSQEVALHMYRARSGCRHDNENFEIERYHGMEETMGCQSHTAGVDAQMYALVHIELANWPN